MSENLEVRKHMNSLRMSQRTIKFQFDFVLFFFFFFWSLLLSRHDFISVARRLVFESESLIWRCFFLNKRLKHNIEMYENVTLLLLITHHSRNISLEM